jgi:hypothetical protein
MAKAKTPDKNSTVSNLRDLAKTLGVSETALRKYRKADGFPIEADNTYDPEAVLDFIATINESDEDDMADANVPETPDSSPANPQPLQNQPPADDGVQWVTIQIPVAKPCGYIASQTSFDAPAVQTRLRDAAQIRGLQHMHAGCRDAHVQLANGHHVDTRADLFRWLFAEVDKALSAAR